MRYAFSTRAGRWAVSVAGLLHLIIPAALLAAVCGGDSLADPSDLEAGGDPIDAAAPPETSGSWYRPGLGVTWQWQIDGTIQTGYDKEIYDVDLFETPASVINFLHGRGRKVLCYFSAGSFEQGRPDSGRSPTSALGSTIADLHVEGSGP